MTERFLSVDCPCCRRCFSEMSRDERKGQIWIFSASVSVAQFHLYDLIFTVEFCVNCQVPRLQIVVGGGDQLSVFSASEVSTESFNSADEDLLGSRLSGTRPTFFSRIWILRILDFQSEHVRFRCCQTCHTRRSVITCNHRSTTRIPLC